MLSGITVTQAKLTRLTVPKNVLFTWCVPNQLILPNSLTDKRLQRKNPFLHEPVVQKVENSRGRSAEMRRWNEEFITFWKQLKCQSTWRTQSDAGIATDTTGWWATHNFTNRSIKSESELLFLPQQPYCHLKSLSSPNPDNSFVFPKSKEKWFLCCCVRFRGTIPIFIYYLYTDFLFCRCRLPLMLYLKVWFIINIVLNLFFFNMKKPHHLTV